MDSVASSEGGGLGGSSAADCCRLSDFVMEGASDCCAFAGAAQTSAIMNEKNRAAPSATRPAMAPNRELARRHVLPKFAARAILKMNFNFIIPRQGSSARDSVLIVTPSCDNRHRL